MKSHRDCSGQALVFTIVVVGLVLVNTLAVIGGSQLFFQNTTYSTQSAQAVNLAEAGVDKAVASLNTTGGTYAGENETFIGSGSYSVTIVPKDQLTVIVQSTGYIPNKTNPKVKRTVKVQASKGVGISFIYGMLVGEGGITMGNGSTLNGSIYSNGSILGGNNELITGDVIVAGGTQPLADQESDCIVPNCSDFVFGKNVGGDNRLDVAQSFKPDNTEVVNKVSLKLKKTGSPPNLTVRLLSDQNGEPNKNSVLASGTLAASLVGSDYGFIDVAFTSNPLLTAGTAYWIVADASNNNSNYWSGSLDTLQGYTGGQALWSSDWQAHNATWNNINGDLGFKTYMGGVPTSITMGNGSIVRGDVRANTIKGLTINRDAYYQAISESTVQGTLYPNSVDSPVVAMPISSSNITTWQNEAESFGISSGNISGCPAALGPGKFIGNMTLSSNCTVTVKTPIWITGNAIVGNSVILRMDASLGSSSGVIIIDGTTTFSNGDDLRGTGVSGSYLMLLSTYDSPSLGGIAIDTGNSSITGILYAPYGTLSLANNATFKEAVARQINMGTGTTLTYDSGLISTFFSSGPGGSFSIVKGTYQVR